MILNSEKNTLFIIFFNVLNDICIQNAVCSERGTTTLLNVVNADNVWWCGIRLNYCTPLRPLRVHYPLYNDSTAIVKNNKTAITMI